jgi:hypothetical protein
MKQQTAKQVVGKYAVGATRGQRLGMGGPIPDGMGPARPMHGDPTRAVINPAAAAANNTAAVSAPMRRSGS